MTPNAFVKALSNTTLDDVFNPYRDRCEIFDRADAPQRRRANLRSFLEALSELDVDAVWIARDLGYRGGRRTGLPLTDEIHLDTFGERYDLSLVRATKGPPMAERTAAIVWRVLSQIDTPVFLWNVFPLHPYERGEPLSNRCHTRAERELFNDMLFTLLAMLQPNRIIAIGRDAQVALTDLGLAIQPVRHPSYGGQSEFIDTISTLYDLKKCA